MRDEIRELNPERADLLQHRIQRLLHPLQGIEVLGNQAYHDIPATLLMLELTHDLTHRAEGKLLRPRG